MNDLIHRPAFAVYALACVVLALNLFVLGGMTGGSRGKSKVFLNPEDAKDGKAAPAEHDGVARLLRCHRNALENFVPFAIIGLLYVMVGASARGAYILFGVYVVARILHSIFYLGGKQPWRTIMFAVGALATLGMMIQVTRAAVALLQMS